MRIDSNVPVPNSGRSGRASEAKSANANRPVEQAGGGPKSNGPVAGDSASISQLATQLGNFPEVRQGRVEALRLSVQNGSYRVDPATVAQAMLGELSGTGSKS